MGRDHAPPAQRRRQELFQSTRPVWGATFDAGRLAPLIRNFNPRAPCGARPDRNCCCGRYRSFQSTRPVWGATSIGQSLFEQHTHFNPRAPCGARLLEDGTTCVAYAFQSTRPVWGATEEWKNNPNEGKFQSTRPVWGATLPNLLELLGVDISIHAPRVGRDCLDSWPPAGSKFQSTRPVWGATLTQLPGFSRVEISIHAPRVGRDVGRVVHCSSPFYFNPRARCGARRPAPQTLSWTHCDFNPRAPCGARR